MPRATLQGELADYLIRTDLTEPELHILATQPRGEQYLRYNLTAILLGSGPVDDAQVFLQPPKLFQANLTDVVGLYYNMDDGFVYAADKYVSNKLANKTSRQEKLTYLTCPLQWR